MFHYMLGSVGELVAFLFSLAAYPVPSSLYNPSPSEANQCPILLVHGYRHNSSAWHLMRYRLDRAGFTPVYTMDLGTPFHSIEEYSQKIKQKAVQIQRETGRNDLILIGHSMGGVASLYYLEHDSQPHTVKKVITLGSPLQGTKLAHLGVGKCVKQISYRKNNEFLNTLLHKISLRNDTLICHLGSDADLIIRPTFSAFPPCKGPTTKCYLLHGLGHFSYLYSSRVFEIVKNELKFVES